ncbi:hypothetical protein ZORO111903_20535 [Zobellia roscoffensis]
MVNTVAVTVHTCSVPLPEVTVYSTGEPKSRACRRPGATVAPSDTANVMGATFRAMPSGTVTETVCASVSIVAVSICPFRAKASIALADNNDTPVISTMTLPVTSGSETEVAVIVTVPAERPVRRPLSSMDAIVSSPEDQVTLGSVAFWGRTAATSWRCAPVAPGSSWETVMPVTGTLSGGITSTVTVSLASGLETEVTVTSAVPSPTAIQTLFSSMNTTSGSLETTVTSWSVALEGSKVKAGGISSPSFIFIVSWLERVMEITSMNSETLKSSPVSISWPLLSLRVKTNRCGPSSEGVKTRGWAPAKIGPYSPFGA